MQRRLAKSSAPLPEYGIQNPPQVSPAKPHRPLPASRGSDSAFRIPHSAFIPRGSDSAFIRRRAFTIIELVVVIVIMLILMAITLPAIRSMMRDNNQKQAVNLVTAMIANARALAMQSHTAAGLVIYEDPNLPNQSSVQLVVQSGELAGSPPLRYFTFAPNTGPEQLPYGISVGTLDDSTTNGGIRTQVASSANTMCRCIIFDSNGQMILVSGLARDTTLTDTSSAAWNLGTSSVPSVSSPGLIVYSAADFKNAEDSGTISKTDSGVSAANWVKQNADLLIVNAYTGNVIRYAK